MTKSALNPQGEQMADESMIRTLAAQIEANAIKKLRGLMTA